MFSAHLETAKQRRTSTAIDRQQPSSRESARVTRHSVISGTRTLVCCGVSYLLGGLPSSSVGAPSFTPLRRCFMARFCSLILSSCSFLAAARVVEVELLLLPMVLLLEVEESPCSEGDDEAFLGRGRVVPPLSVSLLGVGLVLSTGSSRGASSGEGEGGGESKVLSDDTRVTNLRRSSSAPESLRASQQRMMAKRTMNGHEISEW